MKLSLNKRQVVIAGIVIAVVLLGLAVGRSARDGGPQKLDAPAARACSEFADGYARARTKPARLALADRVSQASAGTDNTIIADRVAAVGDNANESDADWKSAADDLTGACRDAGWS
ncbi:hypothetical protein GCM10020358_78450 [Amorphoplanes nipponensis]|uniref:Uncharacterized protein n=1 Tax=Actinoplanes nipponensis TaxID=135950 RepID=A0A919JNY3_9ACTN|nr:hypothetical protein [Actinoplanes nipponensis]GIE52787.1 hypothetical protein Ani05nite_63210 [Actinoplanes nipponensis]